MTKIATAQVTAMVTLVMMVGGCGKFGASSPTTAALPAEITLGSSPQLDALNKANAADQAARQALDALKAACPTDGSCNDDVLRPLRDALSQAKADCVQARDDYLAAIGENLDDSSIGLYPRQLDESFVNPLTNLPFTCGLT